MQAFCKRNLALYEEKGEFFAFDSPWNKDGRGRPPTLETEREELLAKQLHGLVNIDTVVCKPLVKELAMAHYRDQLFGMDFAKKLTDEQMNRFDDAWYFRFCERYGFMNSMPGSRSYSFLQFGFAHLYILSATSNFGFHFPQ